MGNKDKAGKPTKKAATKGLKEKRAEKKAKRAGQSGSGSVDRTFDR